MPPERKVKERNVVTGAGTSFILILESGITQDLCDREDSTHGDATDVLGRTA